MSLIGRCKSWTALKMGHCNKGRCFSTMYNTHKKAKLKAGFLSFISSLHTRLLGTENKTSFQITIDNTKHTKWFLWRIESCNVSILGQTALCEVQNGTQDLIKRLSKLALRKLSPDFKVKQVLLLQNDNKNLFKKIRETSLTLYLQLLETHSLAL